MPVIVPQRRVWTRQPVGTPRIDWSNPLTRGLYLFTTPTLHWADSGLLSNGYNSAPTSTPGGLAFGFFGQYSHLYFTPPAMTEGSALYVGVRPAAGGYSSWSNLGAGVSYHPYSNGNLYASDFAPSRYVYGLVTPGGTNQYLHPYAVATAGKANSHASALNGRVFGSSGSLAFYMPSTVKVGYNDSGQNNGIPLNLFAFWTRRLSNEELCEVSRNPWQIFKPRRRITYIDLGAPAAATLEGHAQAQASATGNLTLAATLDGAALSVATATGTLTTQIPLAGAAVSIVSAAGELLTGIPLSGVAVAQAVAAGSLTAQIRLDGNALAQAAASAGLTSAILLAGNAQGQATATGTLAGETSDLVGDAKAEAAAVATLTTSIRMSGSAAAQAGVSGILTTQIQLTGAALANAIASGVLSVPILLAGAATAEASASGVLSDATEPAAPVYYRLTASVQRVTRLACNDAPLAQIQTGTRRLTTLTHRVTHV